MSRISKVIIVIINLLVGVLHFVVGPEYQGPLKIFVNGYLIDILLPMGLYLLLILSIRPKISISKSRWLSSVVVVVIGFAVETLQYFGIKVFGNTFDPVDYLMYVTGIVLGIIIDLFLEKYFEVKTSVD